MHERSVGRDTTRAADDRNRDRDAKHASELSSRSVHGTPGRVPPGGEGDNGRILYIKPAYHGNEGVGIRSYATANRKFPHEPTADQWFTESQFESYRSLGREIGDKVLGEPAVKEMLTSFFKG